jgi:transcriptional regulator with XRE-family HTH domain
MATVHFTNGCRNPFDDDFDPRLRKVEHDESNEAAADDRPRAGEKPRPRRETKNLHRIAEVRRQQGVTLRNVARRLGIELAVVRRQEQADCDVRVSDLLLWQQVLEVPVADLLVEGEGQLSGPVLERSRMVKLMKTAAAIRDRTGGTPVGRLVQMLVDQILEIMPELSDVTPWHTVGQRRTLDDLGRAASCPVSEDSLRGSLPG